MPRIIDYSEVCAAAGALGLRSLYHNSGAFGFGDDRAVHHLGWIGPPDPTIRPAARGLARHVPPPYEPNLAAAVVRAWREVWPGAAWVLPKSHWAYELDFGSAAWMPAALRGIGIDPTALAPRNDGSALAFEAADEEPFRQFVQRLLTDLSGSDFGLLLPGREVVCTLHHHKQVWWTVTDPAHLAQLERIISEEITS